jgi:hypothetical protein
MKAADMGVAVAVGEWEKGCADGAEAFEGSVAPWVKWMTRIASAHCVR